MKRCWLISSCIALFLFAAASCAVASTITVFAAASLKNALDEATGTYEKNSGHKIVVSYAASPALAKQIENGAPADIFISADLDWMDYIVERGLVQTETRVNLLCNTLVLIASAASTVKLTIGPDFPLARSLGDGRLAMANPDSVPAGKYGKAALESLDVWESVRDRIAPAENVRAALALTSRGETPFGIVYRTDALADSGVRIVGEFPAVSYPPIVYPAAVMTSSKGQVAAQFLRYLSSPPGQKLFAKYGF